MCMSTGMWMRCCPVSNIVTCCWLCAVVLDVGTSEAFALNGLHDISDDDNIPYCDYRPAIARSTPTSAGHTIREGLHWSLKGLDIRSVRLSRNSCVSFDLKEARRCHQSWTLSPSSSMSSITGSAMKSSTLCTVPSCPQAHLQPYHDCDPSLEIVFRLTVFMIIRLRFVLNVSHHLADWSTLYCPTFFLKSIAACVCCGDDAPVGVLLRALIAGS